MKIAIEDWKKEKRFNKKVSSLFDDLLFVTNMEHIEHR
jgi:hypothetical protein